MQKILLGQLFVLFYLVSTAQFGCDSVYVSNDLKIIKLSENTYIHVSYHNDPNYGRFTSNGLIITNQGKALLLDTPITDSLTRVLTQWASETLNVQIVGFVPNHWHNDCMGGLKHIHDIGIVSYANEMTINIAKDKGLIAPMNGFKDSLTLGLGSMAVKCYYLGAAHSADNIVVWIPSDSILFAGCMVKDLKSMGLGNIVDGNIEEWPKTIDILINKFGNAKYVVPGHGNFGGKELLTHTIQLLLK